MCSADDTTASVRHADGDNALQDSGLGGHGPLHYIAPTIAIPQETVKELTVSEFRLCCRVGVRPRCFFSSGHGELGLVQDCSSTRSMICFAHAFIFDIRDECTWVVHKSATPQDRCFNDSWDPHNEHRKQPCFSTTTGLLFD